ncbi:hypothetical protein [Beijerinckia sp. L45]|uniref:hypothetical protein n=1 Tax=Beijerinckia sp. L45 TaxID=1641855 RepID=UPI00131AF31A|nr:hypothetical protein [Beijerinckia sp. L45]
MNTVFVSAVAAALLGSAGVVGATPAAVHTPHHGRAPIHSAWRADTSATTRPLACNGYGYAYGSDLLCETATGGPVGGIN